MVERPCADNVTGLKSSTEAADLTLRGEVVGERSVWAEAGPKGPVDRTEETLPARVAIKRMRTPFAGSLRFPRQGQST